MLRGITLGGTMGTYVLAVVASAAFGLLGLSQFIDATQAAPSKSAAGQNLAKQSLRVAVTCFKSGEKTSGFNKICFYDCLGSERAITIGSTQLCPLTIDG
jgi:hypothetical protein